MANPVGQVLLNTAKNVKEKRDAKKQARAEKQKQDAQATAVQRNIRSNAETGVNPTMLRVG